MDGSRDFAVNAACAADFGSFERDCGLPGAAVGVQRYRANERRWNGFAIRDGRLRAERGFAFEVSYPARCRIALALEGGRAVCRSQPNRWCEDGGAQRPLSFLPAGMNIWGCSNDGGEFRTAMLAFDREQVEQRLGERVDLGKLDAPRLNDSNERLRCLMRCLVEESSGVDGLSSLYSDSLIAMILVEVVRSSANEPNKRGGLTHPQLKRVLARMEEDLQQRVSLSELARLIGLSVSHFCRAFKESTGLAPYRWHLDAKIRVAQRLMLDGDKSLAEIALELGFADQSHFTRTFRRSVGATPKAWLRDRRG